MIDLRFKIKLKYLLFSLLLVSCLYGLNLVFSTPYSVTTYPVNGTIYTVNITWFNITTNTSMIKESMWQWDAANVSCYFKYDGSILNTTNTSMTNDSQTHCYYQFANGDARMTNTIYGMWHNATFYINDTFGIGNVSVSSTLYFKIDTINPTVTAPYINFTQLNTSTKAYINISFGFQDNNTESSYCGIYIAQESVTNTFKIGNLGATGQNRSCWVNLTENDITQDGDVTITYWANDSAGRSTNSSTSENAIATFLKTGWNLVTFTGDQNDTVGGMKVPLRNILDNLPLCTYMSRWNSQAGFKNYSTYFTGTPLLNNGTEVYAGNSTWIYCTGNQLYLRKYYSTSAAMGNQINQTLYSNITTSDTKWNLMGLLSDVNLNKTLYPKASAFYEGNNTWIKAVSWYNTSLGHYISCVKVIGDILNDTLCTGGKYAQNVSLTKGTAVWININLPSVDDLRNITIDRSLI